MQVALRRFVDDVSVLAVEECLMSNAPSLFNRDHVDDLDEEEIRRLAGESDGAAAERERLTEKLNVFERGSRELKLFDNYRASMQAPGMSHSSLLFYSPW